MLSFVTPLCSFFYEHFPLWIVFELPKRPEKVPQIIRYRIIALISLKEKGP